MATKRFAKAIVERKNIHFDEWMEELRNQHEGAVPKDYVGRIAKTVLRKCDPKQYLLSHATIVASVDTYAPKNVKTGRQMNRGIQIDVRWPDFRIKPECHEIINNNGDAWERSLLLSTYRTFIGAQNYLEHIQLPELSKGFIVDAIARDLGKSAYIDILVATDRKHKQLVSDIISGDIDSMSMGCHLPGTLVYLSDGSPINIEDVRPDMEVLTQKGNSCRVDNLQVRENRWKIQTIKSFGLPSITSTDNHKYYIVRRETIEKTRVRTGYGRKSKLRVIEKDYDFDYADAGTVRVGDYLAFPVAQGEEPTSVSLAEARLLGLWVGSGWKFDSSRDSTTGVGFRLDKSNPEIIQGAIESLDQFAWRSRELRMAVGGSVPTVNDVSVAHGHDAAYITNTSHAFRKFIDTHTSGRGAADKLINGSVMQWPRDHQLAFLSGLVDSEGCVSTSRDGTKNVFLNTRNVRLAHQYMQIAARCGIIPILSSFKRPSIKASSNSTIEYQVKLRNSDVIRVPSVKIRAASKDIHPSQFGHDNQWITDKYLYCQVKKITRSEYEGFVYDLQVDKDHSYIANCVGVSNCISLFTTCTKCGNVAADDSQLCPCIQYDGKGNLYVAEDGAQHKIAELIGHVSVPNSNQYIEASWVRNPAFRGAVRRNILNPDMNQVASRITQSKLIHDIKSYEPIPEGLWNKAASVRLAQGQEDGTAQAEPTQDSGDSAEPDQSSAQSGGTDQGQSTDQTDQSAPPADSSGDTINKLVEQAQRQLLEMIVKGLDNKMQPKPEDVGTVQSPVDLESGNASLVRSSDNFVNVLNKKFRSSPTLIRWASKMHRIVHKGGLAGIKSAGLTARDLIVLSWIEDRCKDRNYSDSLYKIAMHVGSIDNFPSEQSFLAACKMTAGRDFNDDERRFLTRKGRIASVSKL